MQSCDDTTSFLPIPPYQSILIIQLSPTLTLLSHLFHQPTCFFLRYIDLCALAFKVTYDPLRGPLVYIRSYSGILSAKQTLYNATRGVRERVNQLLHVNAGKHISFNH